jgi:DNA mismatch repair protein MutS
MSEVTGPPPEMAASRGDLTPMMSQYFELCSAYDDALVLFQVGDFYEAFCDAAEEVSKVCEVTLTQREDSTGTYRMAGVPIDDAASYVDPLLDAGHRVAIADQIEDPDEVSGVVERAVTRVVTPGTVTDDELLSAGSANYLAAVAGGTESDHDLPAGEYAVALVDVTTGEFRVAGTDSWAAAADELDRFGPAEVVVDPALDAAPDLSGDPTVTPGAHDPDAFAPDRAAGAIETHVAPPEPIVDSVAELRAAGAVLAYAEYTQGGADGELGHVSRLRRYEPDEYVHLDATALGSLEVFETRSTGEGPTLQSVLDETASAPGRRRLTAWLRQPLLDREAIERRHDAVGDLRERSLLREDLRESLSAVYDLERLVTRVTRGRADARDLRSLKTSLDAVPEVRDILADSDCEAIAALRGDLDELAGVRDLIGRAVPEDPPAEITEGGVIREGFDDDLDALRETEREGREWVADLEERERDRTGIDSLAVGYNDVHGYYIEVTNPNLDRVPDDYTRRQTLKNSERFYTPELKRREDEILGAAERADAREHELFREVREEVASEADRVGALADTLADLDALASLAAVALDRDYVRPELGAEGVDIEGGRHPVVETAVESFVPNDADLTDEDVAVITGPNMSGKSTYMRQTALIALLAQVGSFVPAERARLPVLDGIYTRVGASDDIAGGQSTFMVEMDELTGILHAATGDSLVLLDEVGRGTSTVDGLSIAWAVTEYVHDEVGATTLFATHYHELTAVADELPGATALHFGAQRVGESVTFRYDVREGAASSSYGVEIARMAGVPDPVVDRSRELVERGGPAREAPAGDAPADPDEAAVADAGDAEAAATLTDYADGSPPNVGNETNGSAPPGDGEGVPGKSDGERTNEDEAVPPELLARLREVDVATMTPLEALNALAEFREMAEAEERDA